MYAFSVLVSHSALAPNHLFIVIYSFPFHVARISSLNLYCHTNDSIPAPANLKLTILPLQLKAWLVGMGHQSIYIDTLEQLSQGKTAESHRLNRFKRI